MKTILSLGAGVQSTTLALMAHKKEIKIDFAIFADTGWEPGAVYDHLKWLVDYVNFPIYQVSNGNIRKDALSGKRFATMPLFVKSKNGGGMLRRQCTREYKVQPVNKKIRELLGIKRASHSEHLVKLALGISLDEVFRMRQNNIGWIENIYPLVDMRMDRADCLAWLEKNNFPIPPKSACIGCPFHDDYTWQSMKKEEFADAVEFDKSIRKLPRIKGDSFLHRSLIPLEDVNFESKTPLYDSFINECEGMCGV